MTAEFRFPPLKVPKLGVQPSRCREGRLCAGDCDGSASRGLAPRLDSYRTREEQFLAQALSNPESDGNPLVLPEMSKSRGSIVESGDFRFPSRRGTSTQAGCQGVSARSVHLDISTRVNTKAQHLPSGLCDFLPAPEYKFSGNFSKPDPGSPHNTLKWASAFIEGLSWANVILHNIKYFLNFVNNLAPSKRSVWWSLNDDFFDEETQGRGSAEFWFGPPTQSTLNSVRWVIAEMTRRITITPVYFTNNWSTHPNWSDLVFRDQIKACTPYWGWMKTINGVKTIFLCPNWAGFNIHQRWSNIAHELTHVAGRSHECDISCKDAPCGSVSKCDGGVSSHALVTAGKIDVAVKNSQTYTNWFWCFYRAHTTHYCYPLSLSDFGPGGTKT